VQWPPSSEKSESLHALLLMEAKFNFGNKCLMGYHMMLLATTVSAMIPQE